VPVDHGQHWTAWLLEWAHYTRRAFVAQPALLNQFVNGSIAVERMAPHMDAVFGVLTRQGFTPADAFDAYDLVNECALGATLAEIRQAHDGQAGQPLSEFGGVLESGSTDSLPHLRRVASASTRTRGHFTDRIVTLLIGIAARRGEPWEPILDLNYTASGPPSPVGIMHP
jgi:hypothetical protein